MNTVIENVSIDSIATCIPSFKLDIFDNKELYKDNRDKLSKLVNLTGFHIRYVIPKNLNITSSDLCVKAAESLLSDIDRANIDAVIMVSQTPDYIAPATSCIIQDRLGLRNSIIAFDVNQGCAGYIYGLFIASKLISKECRKVLLLVGNASSKIFGTGEDYIDNPPIFSDGGSATILSYNTNAAPMYFNMGTDGSRFQSLWHRNGGFRNQPSLDMFNDSVFSYGSFMDGLSVFNFSIERIPESIHKLLLYSDKLLDDVDYFLLHQANKSIILNIAKILDINIDKVPYKTLSKYGNLSISSIPSIISDMYNVFDKSNHRVIMSGFGIGLSWASVYLLLDNVKCLPIILYNENEL